MTKKQFKEIKERFEELHTYKYGRELDVVSSIIDDFESDFHYYDEEFTNDYYSMIYQYTDDEMMYYDDALDYLKDNAIYEFSDAIANGYGANVSSIATYYLNEEVFNLLDNIGLTYDLFE